jgi:hypothetical protein
MTFRKWMKQQNWQGKQLDKDLFGDGKFYSPGTCCFVESWLNKLFTNCDTKPGELPTGVYFYNHRFRACLRVNNKTTHLGCFDTEHDAHQAYLEAKQNHVVELMKNYPDQRIKEAVLSKVM